MEEHDLDVTSFINGSPGTKADRNERCPGCGWPETEPFEVLSQHATSEGSVTWERCACGRLRARRGATVVVRSTTQ